MHSYETVNANLVERKKAQQGLRLTKGAAEAASNAKIEFLCNMSHGVRTPLQTIMGMTELLLESKLTNNQRGHADLIMRSSDTLLEVINDVVGSVENHQEPYILDPRSSS